MKTQEQIDIEICRNLSAEYESAKNRFTSFASKIAVLYCKYNVDQLVRMNNGFTYKITEIKGFASGSERLFGVEIYGINVNKKTFVPIHSMYRNRVKLYIDEIKEAL